MHLSGVKRRVLRVFCESPPSFVMKKRKSRPDRPDSDEKELPRNTFQHAIRPFLLMGQFMGVLPVSGLREPHVRGVHFKWTYVGVAVTLVLAGLGALDVLLALRVILERGLKLYTAGPFTISLTSLLKLLAFFELARHWPELMKEFARAERIFIGGTYETKESNGMCFRLRLIGAFWVTGVLVQHCIYVGAAIYTNHYQIGRCNLTVNFWENLFLRERIQYFSVVDFHMWMIPLIEWFTVSMAFTWNFADIFLMLVTRSLAERFNQVCKRIRQCTLLPMTEDYWLRSRLDFMSLLDLVQAVDDHLANLILVCCANNLYFICFHVFYSFQKKGTIAEIIYFWYLLSFVCARILTMLLSVASINDIAADILAAFYEIPLEFWGVELQRFFEVVSTESIALSGKRFFFITRGMIFAMAGTVVTYELVLLDQVKDAIDAVDFCVSRKL